MSTGAKKINIFLKKFLTQQQLVENFLDYLHNLTLESHATIIPNAGIYTYPAIPESNAVDTIDVLTPGESTVADGNGPQLSGDDGHGRIMILPDAQREQVPVPNENGVQYYVGMRFNYYPTETEINVRTGIIQWSLNQESVGERAEPTVVSYYNNVLQMAVNNVCHADTPQTGRIVRVWLKVPKSQAVGDVFEDAVIAPQSIVFVNDGATTYFDVPNELAGYFTGGQSLTIDKTPSSPTTCNVNSVGIADSGGAGNTRVFVDQDLSGYTVSAGSFVLTGHNIVNLIDTLGQGTAPSIDPTLYENFLYGLTVSTDDLRLDEYYAYLFRYIGTGVGNNPSSFDFSDQNNVPENLADVSQQLKEFKRYQLARNSMFLRGGGQVEFESGDVTWSQQFEIVNPFRGVYTIAADTINGIANDDILYAKIWEYQPVVIDGKANGEIWIEDNTDLVVGAKVIIGDKDSNKVTGVVNTQGVGSEKLIIWDGGGSPLDLSAFTTIQGAWIQRTDTEIVKEQINQGDLRPDIFGTLNEDVFVIATRQNDKLLFRDGILKLEDGDVGEISNLPSGFNFVNNVTELVDSVVKTADDNVVILSPKTYTLANELQFPKNLTWVGLTDRTIVEGNEAIEALIQIDVDLSTTEAYQSVSFKNLTIRNNGAGPVVQIDNAGATKGMVITFENCQLIGNGGLLVDVKHSQPTQYIKVNIVNSKIKEWTGSIDFDSPNNDDELNIHGVKFAAGNSVKFGRTASNVTSKCEIVECLLDEVEAVGTGTNKSINLVNTYPASDQRARVNLTGNLNATFKVFSDIRDILDLKRYQASNNAVNMVFNGNVDFVGGTLSWDDIVQFIDPFYGTSEIAIGNLTGIVNDDILFVELFQPHEFESNGTFGGEIKVNHQTEFNIGDKVAIGDNNSTVIYANVTGEIDEYVTVDTDVSAYTVANGAWVRRVNTTLQKSQAGDLTNFNTDEFGQVNENLYIVGQSKQTNSVIVLKNGETIQPRWVYEESELVTAAIAVDDEISLPVDSRNSGAAKTYKNGSGTLEFDINGVRQRQEEIEVVGSFDPVTYTTGTGVVAVVDGVDLSNVRIHDIFKDAAGAEFSILGDIDDTAGQKQFKIGTGETVDVTNGATIFRQDYYEFGSVGDWVGKIVTRKEIPVNAVITFRVVPIEKIGSNAASRSGELGQYENPTISQIDSGSVVTKQAVGQVKHADYNTAADACVIGIALENLTASGGVGNVQRFNRVPAAVFSTGNFVEAAFPADGSRVWLHASGKMTVTQPVAASGKELVHMGIWDDGELNLQINYLGVA